MGKNRIWYSLLWVVMIVNLVPVVHVDYDVVRLVLHRWTWAVFLSPSAAVFFGALCGSIFFPIKTLALIPVFFVQDQANETYRKRYLYSFLTVLGICVGELVIMTIMWGSFPLEVDAHNYIRLRMIPFLPWPAREFLVFE